MFNSRVRRIFSAVSRTLDVLPEPLVLRALDVPQPTTRSRV